MTKYEDILASVVSKLEARFSEITIESNDVEEGFDRPSFFTSLDGISSSDFMDVSVDRNMTARIIYFPTHKTKNQVELLSMMDSLDELFLRENIIKIDEDVSIEVEQVDLKIVSKVLHCSFKIVLCEDYERPVAEFNMEDLEYQMN